MTPPIAECDTCQHREGLSGWHCKIHRNRIGIYCYAYKENQSRDNAEREVLRPDVSDVVAVKIRD